MFRKLCLIVISVVSVFAVSAFAADNRTSETVFTLSDDLMSAIQYYNSRSPVIFQKNQFNFGENFDRKLIMYARPENYYWEKKNIKGTDYNTLIFPDTNSYAYLQRYTDTKEFLISQDKTHYKLVIDGSLCVEDNCLMAENIISAVLPQRFKVTKYDSNVKGNWKIVGNTYTFYARDVKGANIVIEFDDTVPEAYIRIAKGLEKYKDISTSYDRNIVKVVMPMEGLFDSGSAIMKKQGEQWVESLVTALKTVEYQELRVEGHTDNVPILGELKHTFPTNWELSTTRATNVVRFMINNNLPSYKTAAVGYADTQPIGDNNTPEGKNKNRRIEFTVVLDDRKN